MAEIMEQLAHRVYKLDYPPRKRTRPMEVLAVGISRSGTESLRQAIEILGVSPTFHGFDAMLPPSILQEFYRLVDKKWCKPAGPNAATGSLKLTREDFDHLWGNHVAVTDLPAATFARELIHAYPEAKVILNHRRDVEDWHRSYMQTLEQMPGLNYDSAWLKSWFCAELFWITKGVARGQVPYFLRGSAAHNGPWVYEEHVAMVRGLGLPPDRLLEWTVEDGWEPLCRFLGKDVPEQPFPKGNNPVEFDIHLGRVMKAYNDRAVRNMSICAALVVAFMSSLLFAFR